MKSNLNAYGIYVAKTVRFATIECKIKPKLRIFNYGKLINKNFKNKFVLIKLEKFSNNNK